MATGSPGGKPVKAAPRFKGSTGSARTVCALGMITVVAAQDPARGWMAYAVGSIPSQYERITRMEMTWTVSADARPSRAFYSPWFGMDPADNLNLLQPVNPWGGQSWSMYTQYNQYNPGRARVSKERSVEQGQMLRGSIEWDPSSDAYIISQTILETGVSSSQRIEAQDHKKFTVPYIVYEKTWPCENYPPDGKVTFRDILVECDGDDCTELVVWQPEVEDDNCDMKAVIHSNHQISIVWDTSLPSKYDNRSWDDLVALNARNGWARPMSKEAVVQLLEA